VIVGAGLTGLRCAERLGDTVDVVLLEAQDRVGGRCWSSGRWQSGQVAEHGGELIEEGQTHVLRVIAELGLSLESRSAGPRGVRILRDGHVHDASAIHGFGAVLQRLGAAQVAIGPVNYRNPSRALRELDDMTASDWIESNVEGGLSSDLGSLPELSSRITLGFDTRSVSAVSLIHLWLGLPEIQDAAAGFRFGQNTEAGPGDELTFADTSAAAVVDVSHVAGGNYLIAQGLAARLPPGCLQLASPVSSIVRGGLTGVSWCRWLVRGTPT